jgi:hypothetical protein
MRRIALAGVLAVAALFLVGCAGFLEDLETSVEEAEQVRQEGLVLILDLEEEIDQLPEGDPLREALEGRVENVREVVDEAEEYLYVADGLIDGYRGGELSPGVTDALRQVPYGIYIAFAVSVFFAVKKRYDAGKIQGHLERVIDSWRVGPELTPDEKAQVRQIQGPETTAEVAKVKATKATATT